MKRNKIILLGVSALLILLLLFFWKEKLSFSSQINSSKFGDFATFIGSLLTAITVFLLYKQIKEMAADRKASNQPDLYPAEAQFITQNIDNYNFLNISPAGVAPTFFKMTPTGKSEHPSLRITLNNIGLGAAKEIKLSWIFSEEEVGSLIKEIYALPKYHHNEKVIDFISAGQATEIDLPYEYMVCCGVSVNDTLLDTIEPVTTKPKPNLQLHLVYSDIYENSHTKQFNAVLECNEVLIKVKFSRVR